MRSPLDDERSGKSAGAKFGTAEWSVFRSALLLASFCGAVSGGVKMNDAG
jgi:hypothetical protein